MLHGSKSATATPKKAPAQRHLHGGAHPEAAAPKKSGTLLLVLLVAQLMVILDITAVNVALPTWPGTSAPDRRDIGWTITSYSLIFGSLLLLGGRAADLLGRRRVFLTGLGVFTARLARLRAGGHAPARCSPLAAGQGLGAAMLSPAALSIIMTTFHGAASGRRRSPPGAPSAAPARRSACCSAAP